MASVLGGGGAAPSSPPSSLVGPSVLDSALGDRRRFALHAPMALAAVLAHRRPSALLAPLAVAAVLAYRRPSTLLAPRLLLPVLAMVLPLLRPHSSALEPAALERHLLVLAALLHRTLLVRRLAPLEEDMLRASARLVKAWSLNCGVRP